MMLHAANQCGLEDAVTGLMEEDVAHSKFGRVAILALNEAGFLEETFSKRGLAMVVCVDMEELCGEVNAGADLAVIEGNEMTWEDWSRLAEALASQPSWSDFPIIVLTDGETAPETKGLVTDPLQNAILLERPIGLNGLWSSVRVALRARRRQYEIRDRERTPTTLRAGDLLNEKNFADAAINSLPGIFYLLNDKGGLVRWSKTMETVTGYSAAEIGRMNALDFFSPQYQPLIVERMAEAFSVGQATADAPLLTKDGREIPYFFSGKRCFVESQPCLAGMGIDVTKGKQAEEALREARDRLGRHALELEKRVEERTRNLQASVESLESVLYHVAHDLRAPLRTMEGFTTILLNEHAAALGEIGADYAQRVSVAATRMDRLIQDLLAYGRLTHAAMSPSALDLKRQVQHVLEQLGAEIHVRKASVRIEEPLPEVYADPAVLDLLLTHLIKNALTFVARDVAPEVQIRAERLESGMIRVSIQDNGMGIAAEHHDRIFRVFERLHGSDVNTGTGIGLALVRNGVERMGGAAGVESKIGAGSRFWLDLPAVNRNA